MANTIYIDNLHKQLYATVESTAATAAASRHTDSIGLSDFGELPGQSTWYIRSIRFYSMGFQDEAGGSLYTEFSLLAGIANRDLAPGAFDTVNDYQDVSGWPLNKVQKQFLLLNNPQKNFYSYQHTYTPSKNLTLNREQDIFWVLKNETGNTLTNLMAMYIHAERGD
jgi:hypothetical protein